MTTVSPVRRFGFVGATASQSSINDVFPRWAEILQLGPVTFDPIDLPVDVAAGAYRDLVDRIALDVNYIGALVTNHKVRLLQETRNLFTELDEYAELLGEVSLITKRAAGLRGSAKDPLTSGATMHSFLPPHHFQESGGHVVCFGAGGSGLAIAMSVLTLRDGDTPCRVTLVDRRQSRLDECAEILAKMGVQDKVHLIDNEDPQSNDRLLANQPPHSLIINATGMGKDFPGSPISKDGIFPERSFVWETNYRGELDFLRQASAQRVERQLVVEDGWNYFVNSWGAVIGDAFEIDIDASTLEQLGLAAAEVRG